MTLLQLFAVFVNGADVLEFIPYEKETEIHGLPFMEDKVQSYTVICPHPTLADSSRLFFSSEAQVLTISRFVKDKLALAYPEAEIQLKGKADLLLFLSGVWRSRQGPQKLETFKQAFKLFTELRSFTLDLTLIDEILPEFGEEVAQAIKLFWLVCEQLELVDEHKGYSLLSEAYRTLDNPVNEKASIEGQGERYIFWGFRHLSALQVDFLKALSLRHKIIIPIPRAVLSSLQSSDWPSWLGLASSDFKGEPEGALFKVVSFPKGRLSEKIQAYVETTKIGASPIDVLLCTETPELNYYLEVPLKKLHYRSQLELWKGDFEKVFSQLANRENNFEDSLQALIAEALRLKEFSKIKILLLFKTVFSEWQNLSDEHKEPTHFDEMIMREITLLKLPRSFIFPLLPKQQGSIYSLREAEALDENRPLLICASSKYEDLKSGSEAYNTRVMEFLRAIGPVQRKELSFSFVKNTLRQILTRSQTLLFFEEGLLEHMLSWSDIFKGLKEEHVEIPAFPYNKKNNDPLAEEKKVGKLEKISATTLQAYLDCPRKFYYSYVQKIKERPEFETELRSDELGTLEHEVIEYYLNKHEIFDNENHLALVSERLGLYLGRQGKNLSLIEREKAFWEIRNYSRNGILALLTLKIKWPGLSFSFEEKLAGELEGLPLKGSADCVITVPEGWALLDFKRSDSSIPSKKEIEDLESIQIPFYLTHLSASSKPCLFWGHLNLASIEDSQVFAGDELSLARLQQADFLEGKKITQFQPDLNVYMQKEKELLGQIKEDSIFSPLPLSKDVCNFCDLANICTRGEK